MSRQKQRLPDFFIVGAAKSGTASLCKYLEQHPRVEIVSTRLEHFGEYGNPAIGNLTDEEYLTLFDAVAPSVMAGEKSVSYLYSNLARRQIAELRPDAKIVILLRNPVDRAYSDYWTRIRTGVETLSFEAALDAEEQRISDAERFELHYRTYGLYSDKISAYFDSFGRQNVGVYLYDDFRNDPLQVVQSIYRLLDVDDSFVPADPAPSNVGGSGSRNPVANMLFWMARQRIMVSAVNTAVPPALKRKVTQWMNASATKKGYPPMDSATRRRLIEYYRADMEKLSRLIDRDVSGWLDTRS